MTHAAHHDHDHGHDGHGHGHHHHAASARAVGIAALLTGGFLVVEVAGGLISGSLALLADAGHMLTDFAALAMAWLAFRVARRPADARAHLRLRPPLGDRRLRQRPRALRRRRLDRGRGRPPPRRSRPGRGRHHARRRHRSASSSTSSPSGCSPAATASNLNLRAALLHVAGDLLGSAGAIVAALVILRTGWTPDRPDPLGPRLAPHPALGLVGGARQRPHPARGDARGLRRRRHRRRPRRRRAGGHRRPPPARLVDHRGPPHGHARGRRRRRRPTPTPRAGRSRRASPRPSASTTPPSRSASTPAANRAVACTGLRVYLDALSEPEARLPCRSRSPRPFPPTTCSGARA